MMFAAKMLFPTPPKCMQQIAFLIITFAVYVAGIRNAGNTATTAPVSSDGGGNVGAIADYESYSAPYNEDFRPSQLLSEVTEVISTATDNIERRQSTPENSGDFRPSQIISFTPSDAQSTLKQYPPSYVESNFHTQHISKGGPYGLVSYNKDDDKQFTFPRETEQTPVAAALVGSANRNIEKYLYTSVPRPQTTTQQSLVPAQLHTTPILIYRDPYTNKLNKSQRQDFRPAPPPEPIYQQSQYAEAGRPQEYTVQSMLVVGAEHPTPPPSYAYNHQRPQFALNGGENKRPGYVFDEQVSSSYNRPVYSGNRYELGASAASTPSTTDYNRRDGDTQTERPYEGKLGVSPSTPTKISYDSHDYPPPSYYQQQTSNFQTPQRQDSIQNYQQQQQQQKQPQSTYVSPAVVTSGTTTAIKSGRPELTSSNYANKFGNYLQGGGGKTEDSGYYKRPPPHYSNDILYVTPPPPTAPERPHTPLRPAAPYYTQSNEPLRRPLTPHSDYNQYQLGEIPPPQTLQTVLGSGQRPPPAREQYTTPQRYPYDEDYQSPQGYQPPHSLPAAQNYAPSQNYQPLQSYPPAQQYPPPPNYRPPPPTYQPQQPTSNLGAGMGGLASLASFFTGTQQYAPQFTNLLLGGNGGGGGLLHALTGTRPLGAGSSGGGGGRPPNMQLIKALENIARNDDLECVPKVLCNMIASQTQRGQLPGFVTSPAITNFLAGFPTQSPALIYGRAALLGISGGERSCTQTYAKCPKNEYEILYYLNNHRGGFFKFFSESEEQKPSKTQYAQQSSDSSGSTSGGTSLFSLLSALTGAEPPVTTTTPRPTPAPTVASFDITQGIGNFFSNILSEYISGVEYQRRSSRSKRDISFVDNETNEQAKPGLKFPKDADSEDFHDEEDDEDTQDGIDFDDEHTNESNESAEYGDTQGRVVFKSGAHDLHFFPEGDESGIDERLKDVYLQEVINKFNAAKSERKLKFPTATDTKLEGSAIYDATVDTDGGEVVHFREENEQPSDAVRFGVEHGRPTRRGKALVFQENEEATNHEHTRETRVEYDEQQNGQRVIFPDHYEKHIRKGKILNRPILYAANYDDYMGNAEADRLVLSDSQRPEYNHIDDSADNTVSYEDKPLGPIYISQSSTQQHNTQSTNIQVYNDNRLHYNRGADTYKGGDGASNRYRPTSPSTYSPSSSSNYNSNRYSSTGNSASNYYKRPYYAPSSSSSSSGNRYDYPNTNYVTNNRYGSRYQTTRYTTTTTRSPRGSDNDQNIYVTNAQGVTTHYITPNGGKVYL